MRSFTQRFRKSELGGLAGDTSYVVVWQGSAAIAELVQIALVTHALGLTEYGRLTLAAAFVALVGGFFNVRVGIAATTHGFAPLAQGAHRTAARVFRFAYMIDFGTIACALLVVGILAPIFGPSLVGEGGTALILVYSLVLVGEALDNTSITVLRLLDRFRRVAVNSAAIEACRICLVVAALASGGTLLLVVAAVAVAKVGGGLVNAATAAGAFKRAGEGWRLTDRVGPMERDARKAMLGTIFHTNLVSYAKIGQVQVPTLLVGALAGPAQAGVYKLGMALAAGITKLTDPASAALLPRFTRLWVEGRKRDLKQLVRHMTLIFLPILTVALIVLVVFRDQLLQMLGGGPEGTAAGTVLILGAVGAALDAAVFWRTSLLYAVGRAATLAKVLLAVTLLQVLGVAALAAEFGADGAAVAFLVSRIVTAVALSSAAIRALAAEEPSPVPALLATGRR